jgi:hypothetical protein
MNLDHSTNSFQTHYILGIGRSGSTLLTTLLNAHSQIKAIPEVPIATFFAYKYGKIKSENSELEKNAKEYLEAIQKIRPKHLVNLHAEKLITGDLKYNSYSAFLNKVFSNFDILEKQGNYPIVVDKNPYYTFHYDALCKLSPNAKFIVMVRDYRANILSRKKKTLNKSGNIIFNAFLCRLFFKEINSFRTNKNCLLVRYEDLVSNQVETLTSICQFLNIEFEQNLIGSGIQKDISSNIESAKSEKFIKEHFSELNNPVHSGNTEKWKTELSIEEIEICDAICSKEAISLGYSPISSSQKSYSSLFFKNLPKFIKAYYNVKKERILYYMPIGMKLKRLNQKL